MVAITLNDILSFIKSFVGWQSGVKPFYFKVISQQKHKAGQLLRVSRESVTNNINSAEISTYIFIPNNKSKPYLFIFLDSLEGLGIRNLSHRIQILNSERHVTDDTVKVNIHISESYYLGTHNQANSIILKLIHYCHSRNYDITDWGWEINACRKQILSHDFTDFTQTKARYDYEHTLTRFEMRYSSPRSINPIILDKITDLIEPKAPKPKSRIIELILVGCLLIGIAWFIFR